MVEIIRKIKFKSFIDFRTFSEKHLVKNTKKKDFLFLKKEYVGNWKKMLIVHGWIFYKPNALTYFSCNWILQCIICLFFCVEFLPHSLSYSLPLKYACINILKIKMNKYKLNLIMTLNVTANQIYNIWFYKILKILDNILAWSSIKEYESFQEDCSETLHVTKHGN